jgi:hypothetical protein
MARGIEELAEMQVTGPVQGGDMVMKPNEAPVGAAALLNKMSRQNTPGIFKLPMPDKQMPDFMKVAAEGVEQQTAQGDSINKMAGELMRQGINIQGMGMDEIMQIYEQTFGSPGDVDEFGVSKIDPSDWRTIIKILEAGGDPGTETQMTNLWQTWQKIKDRAGEGAANDWLSAQEAQAASLKFPGNFTSKDQNVTELPRNLKTGPDNPETELAYITNDEKAILALMNPGTPHEGPEGVPTYDEGDYLDYTPSGLSETGYRGPTGAQMSGSQGAGPGTGAIQETMLEAALAGDTGQTYGAAAAEAGYDFAQPAAVEEQKAAIQAQGNINRAVKSLDTHQQALLTFINEGKEKDAKRLMNSGVTLPTNFLTVPGVIAGAGVGILKDLMTDDKKETEDGRELSEFEKMVRDVNEMTGGKIGTLAKGPFGIFPAVMQMISDPKAEQFSDNNYLAIMKDKYLNTDGSVKEGMQKDLDRFKTEHKDVLAEGLKMSGEGSLGAAEKGGFKTFEEAMKSSVVTAGSDLERRLNPTKYWEENKPVTGQDFKDMATAQAQNKLEFTSGNTMAIEEGRRLLEGDRKSGQERHPGTGIPVEKITEEEEVVTTTTDPRAGAFNVGGTMPYTHDVATAGVETDVPLGRRFGIDKAGKYRGTTGGMDLNEAMQYATLGGYSQLEPFQEYLTRRREHLDEDEPVYFDEDGNVIYSEVT